MSGSTSKKLAISRDEIQAIYAEGAHRFSRICGYISTLKKQGLNVLDALKQVFLGNPTIPQPE